MWLSRYIEVLQSTDSQLLVYYWLLCGRVRQSTRKLTNVYCTNARAVRPVPLPPYRLREKRDQADVSTLPLPAILLTTTSRDRLRCGRREKNNAEFNSSGGIGLRNQPVRGTRTHARSPLALSKGAECSATDTVLYLRVYSSVLPPMTDAEYGRAVTPGSPRK